MPPDRTDRIEIEAVRQALRGQYVAALTMLREAILRCPDDLWNDTGRSDAYDVIACNAVFFARYLLHADEDAFRPWPGFEPASDADTDDAAAQARSSAGVRQPNSTEEALAYVDHVIESLDGFLARIDLSAPSSGFHWSKMSKLEQQLANLRRLQHHTGRLVDRLSYATGNVVAWRDADRADHVN